MGQEKTSSAFGDQDFASKASTGHLSPHILGKIVCPCLAGSNKLWWSCQCGYVPLSLLHSLMAFCAVCLLQCLSGVGFRLHVQKFSITSLKILRGIPSEMTFLNKPRALVLCVQTWTDTSF